MAFGQPKSGTDTLKLAAWSLQLAALHSPTEATVYSFKWSDNIFCNPTAVKATGLRGDALAVYVTGINSVGVEGDVVLYFFKSFFRFVVIPGGIF